MAKTTAPLLSIGASGQLGKTLVSSKWRGVPYMRQYVIPGNPNTTAQQAVRSLFAYLREMWKLAPSGVQASWDAFAKGRPFTGMNKWVGENVRVLNGESDMNNLIFCPGARGGLPPVSVTVETGEASGQIAVSGSAPTAPEGWTFGSLAAAAVPDADPTGIFTGPFVYADATSTPYEVTLSGLGSAIACQVGVWATWTKPNGDTAYSVATTYQATSDA